MAAFLSGLGFLLHTWRELEESLWSSSLLARLPPPTLAKRSEAAVVVVVGVGAGRD